MQKSADVTNFVVAAGDDVIVRVASAGDDVVSIDDVVSCITLLDVVVISLTGWEVKTQAVVSCTFKKLINSFQILSHCFKFNYSKTYYFSYLVYLQILIYLFFKIIYLLPCLWLF